MALSLGGAVQPRRIARPDPGDSTFRQAWTQSVTRTRWLAAALTASNVQGVVTGPNGSTTAQAGINNAGTWWILSNQTIDKAGHVFTGPAPQACLSQTAPFQACQNALGRLHLRTLVTYQPASRFWTLQWYETGIFPALAAALAGFCFWWINRRNIA